MGLFIYGVLGMVLFGFFISLTWEWSGKSKEKGSLWGSFWLSFVGGILGFYELTWEKFLGYWFGIFIVVAMINIYTKMAMAERQGNLAKDKTDYYMLTCQKNLNKQEKKRLDYLEKKMKKLGFGASEKE